MVEDSYPILTCAETIVLEASLLQNDEGKIWDAMVKVGKLLGERVFEDFHEIRELEEKPRILVLAGKGHNGGDAFLGALELLKFRPQAKVTVLFGWGKNKIKPLASKAFKLLTQETTVEEIPFDSRDSVEAIIQNLSKFSENKGYAICLDGLLGVAFKQPLEEPIQHLLLAVRQFGKIELNAAVDLPSGLSDEVTKLCFKANFTYTAGVPKAALFDPRNNEWVGRIRFLDIGFFEKGYKGPHATQEFLLASSILKKLQKLRLPMTDKRHYGHLYVLAGSMHYPGALLMNVKSAVKSGVGLVTVFAPEPLVAAFASAVPEAIWVGCPIASSGCFDFKTQELILKKQDKATALLIGAGMGSEDEVSRLVGELVEKFEQPMILDADALQRDVASRIRKRNKSFGGIVITPHMGEFLRVSEGEAQTILKDALLTWNRNYGATILLKGSISRICYKGIIYNSIYGGPVLARGGSGDILGGLLGGLLAQNPENIEVALCTAAIWHGVAADILAREQGQVAVSSTEILNYLGVALRHLQ